MLGRQEASHHEVVAMQRETFDVFCPTCNLLTEANVIAQGSVGYRSSAVTPLDEVDAEYHGDRYSVALCRRCNGPFLVREALDGVPGEFETVTDEAVLLRSTTERISGNVLGTRKQAGAYAQGVGAHQNGSRRRK